MSSFTKGLLTGVFGVVVGLVISGSNYQEGQDLGKYEKYRVKPVGRYQISITTDTSWIYETILDTQNNRVVSRKRFNYDEFKRD